MMISALTYSRIGWPVVPTIPGTKRPATKRGVYDASTDPDIVSDMFRKLPGAGIAVAVGSPIGALVIDIDPRNGGFATWASLELEHGPFPPTVQAKSGSGGEHLFYRVPPLAPGQRFRGKIGCGVDVLGDGRYVLVEPSKHPSGGMYRWINAPWRSKIAEMPSGIAELVVDKVVYEDPCFDVGEPNEKVTDRARRYLDSIPGAISGRGGHSHTFLVAQKIVRGFGLDDATALDLMVEWNKKCEPPWRLTELRRKIKQARKCGYVPFNSLVGR